MSLEREKGDIEVVLIPGGKDVGVPTNCRELGVSRSPEPINMNEGFLKQCLITVFTMNAV